MSLGAALYTGVSGLLNNGEAMNVIGNNISNVNTVGFKQGRTLFSDQLSQSIGNNSQIGKGVQLQTVQNVFTQGSTQGSENVTDLSIQGNSFFALKSPTTTAPVSAQSSAFLSRAGAFHVDNALALVNPDGYQVLDTTGNPIVFVNSGTSPSTDFGKIVKIEPNGLITYLATDGITQNYYNKSGGLPGITKTAAATIVKSSADAAKVITDAAAATAAATATAADTAAIAADAAATAAGIAANNVATVAALAAATAAADAAVVAAGTAAVTAAASAAAAAADPSDAALQATADDDALALAAADALVASTAADLAIANGPAAAKVIADAAKATADAAKTTAAAVKATADADKVAADAVATAAATALTNVLATAAVDDALMAGLMAIPANSTAAQRLAVVTAMDPTALTKSGSSLYQSTTAAGVSAGAFTLAGNQPNSTSEKILSNTLEQSNVDMASEFVKMIVTQRAYSANSKTITTTDQMTQEVLNLVR